MMIAPGRLGALNLVVLFAFFAGHARSVEAEPASLSDRDIDEIWKEFRAMMPENAPAITRMRDTELIAEVTGEWVCLMGVDPYANDQKLSLAIRDGGDREVVFSGTDESGPWKHTGEWRVANGKIVIFQEASDLPGFVFPMEGQLFILNPLGPSMRSKLLRKVNQENATEIAADQIVDYYWSAESLEAIGKRALDRLTAELMKPVEGEGDDHHLALTAIDLLRPPPDKVLPAITDCFNRGVSLAALIMARTGGPDAVEPLVAALTSARANVRASAAWTLAEMRPDEDGHLRIDLNGDERVWKDFRDIGDVAGPALIECLRDEDATVRHRSAYALGQIGGDPERAVPALLESLSDEEGLVREHAADALGAFAYGVNEKAVVSRLKELLNDPVPEVRAAARRTLKPNEGTE